MGEKIEFPRNYRTYIQKAEEAVSNGQIIEAQGFLEKAYDIKKEPHVNAFYVSVLIEAEKYSEALEVAEDFKEMYEEDVQHNLLYLFLLIKNHHFEQAKILLDHLKTTDEFKKNELNQMEELMQEESVLQFNQNQEKLKRLTKKLFVLSDLSIEEQLMVVDQARSLSAEDLISAIPFVMNHPYVSYLVKSLYLQTMIKRGVDFDFKYPCFELEEVINPSTLPNLDQDPVVVEVNRQLVRQLEKNPSLLELIRPELNLHLMTIYPYTNQIVKDENKWVEMYIRYYTDGTSQEFGLSLTQDEQEIISWIAKLSGLEG